MTTQELKDEKRVEQKEEIDRIQKILPQVQKEIEAVCVKHRVRLVPLLKTLPDGIITEMAIVNRNISKQAVQNPKPPNPYQAT